MQGSGDFFNKWGHLPTSTTNGYPTPQAGFFGSSLGQNRFLKTSYTQGTPPSNMGGGQPKDDRFAQGNRDVRPEPRLFEAQPLLAKWVPLWSEPEMVRGRLQHEYEWDFLTSHGAVEDVLLHRDNATSAPDAAPYTTPTVYMRSTNRLTKRAKNSLTK